MYTRRADALRYLAQVRKHQEAITARMERLEQAICASEEVSASLAHEADDIRLHILLQSGTMHYVKKALAEAAEGVTPTNLEMDGPMTV